MLSTYFQLQEKRLYEGVEFIIKILIKSLSNVSYLLMPLKGMKLLIKYELLEPWCRGLFIFLKFEMKVSS